MLIDYVNKSSFLKIHLDTNCIIGWSKTFYNSLSTSEITAAKNSTFGIKDLLFNALKNPTATSCFQYIYPWTGNEDDLKYILDVLNDPLNKEQLGAYYTPIPYASLSVLEIKKIIANLPVGVDGKKNYVIIDRCGGSGNLESIEAGFDDDMLAHTIIGTYEFKEWEVLVNRLGSKLLDIIPNNTDSLKNGLLLDANALNTTVFNQCKKYVEDPTCTVILYENPPYRDSSHGTLTGDVNRSKSTIKDTIVYKEMWKERANWNIQNISTVRDSVNNFIWSGFKYYLTKPTDYYIVYSPIKYWKSIHLINKEFINGYMFNRAHFHAGKAGVSCIVWKNTTADVSTIRLHTYDIDKNNQLMQLKDIIVPRITTLQTTYYTNLPKTKEVKLAFLQNNSTIPDINHANLTNYLKLAYMQNNSVILDFKNANLVNYLGGGLTDKDGFSRGTWLTVNNVFSQIVPYCSNYYPTKTFFEKEVLMKTADGGWAFDKDESLKTACFIYACLSPINNCGSFINQSTNADLISLESDHTTHLVKNEMCLDVGTMASNLLATRTLTIEDTTILSLWNTILNKAKQKPIYNPSFTYGLKQIDAELNTFKIISVNNKNTKVYDDPIFNTEIEAFKKALNNYYDTQIKPKLITYGLIK